MASSVAVVAARGNVYDRRLRFKLGNYIFEIIGQKLIDLHGLNTSKEPYNLVYIQTFTLDGTPLMRENGTAMIFSVYNSESQAGFCRLASINPADGSFVKGDDYAQTTVIHFKLGRFILNALQRGGIIPVMSENPYTTATNSMGDVKREYKHLKDASRPIRGPGFGAVAAPQEACGKFTPRIAEYLKETSAELRHQYPTVIDVVFVCSHVFKTGIISIRGRIFKIGLRSRPSGSDGDDASQPAREIEIYVLKYTCRRLSAVSPSSHNKYTFVSSVDGSCIPVLIKRRTPTADGGVDDDVSAFGTYANYIPGFGAYICKIFEYTLQLPKELTAPGREDEFPKLNGMYTYVGNLYAQLYPAEILNAALDARRVILPLRARGVSLSLSRTSKTKRQRRQGRYSGINSRSRRSGLVVSSDIVADIKRK